MTPAASKNIPDALKSCCAGWPLFSVTFAELLELVAASEGGRILAGRFTLNCHSAYLVSDSTRTLYRCVQVDPMRVKLRRSLCGNSAVSMWGVKGETSPSAPTQGAAT